PAPEAPGPSGAGTPDARTRHIRVDLGRLDGLMDLIGELVTVRGRLNELAAERRDPAIDDVAIQVSRLSSELQAEIIQARMTPVWQVFDRFPRLVRVLARPGFSTAEAVTSVSGRGVGIDVAMTRIRALGGSLDIRTEAGKGTTFVMRLPVTLAIVRALIAGVGPERYALPLTYVA